jgi:hypothetical protein
MHDAGLTAHDARRSHVEVEAPMLGSISVAARMVFVESLHILLTPLLFRLSHAFCQMRLQVQERPRGAFRRKP